MKIVWALLEAAALSAMTMFTVDAQASATCAPAEATEFGGAAPAADGILRRPELNLAQPGRRCLAGDLHQRKLVHPRTGREMRTIGGDAIVLIGADDVSLDLGGHTIANERELGYSLVKHYRYEPGRGHSHAFLRTRIRNGTLRSPGSRGIGVRLVSARTYGPDGFGIPVPMAAGKVPADVYRDTGHLLESLVIEAGSRAILIDGKNNVIRNNRITVDGTTAIVAQGPGVVIENNLIEVRGQPPSSSGHDRGRQEKSPFVIRLIQADGAVVRNNHLRLVDVQGTGPLPAAIELVASRDVLVEANRLEGMQAAVRADTAGSHREAGNRIDTCPDGETRFLSPDETGENVVARPPVCRSPRGPRRDPEPGGNR